MKEPEITEKDNYPEKIETKYVFEITRGQSPERVDVFLSQAVAGATRNRVQKAIDSGMVMINGSPVKASRKVQPLDKVEVTLMKPPPMELVPEDIALNIVYEDKYVLVVDKPAGMCVHPGFGNRYGTLVNALLYHFGVRENIQIEVDDTDEEETSEGEIFAGDDVRPGLVHRIDKDTSGLLLIAKDPVSHAFLAKQFADKTTEREYWAVVWGTFKESQGEIADNIGRSPKDRKIFTAMKRGGKTARTDYFVLENMNNTALVKFVLHTGRTHQIRVHAQSINRPIFGDQTYGGDTILYGGEKAKFRQLADKCLKIAQRQILHAKTLGFIHPETQEFMRFESALPQDFQEILALLDNKEKAADTKM